MIDLKQNSKKDRYPQQEYPAEDPLSTDQVKRMILKSVVAGFQIF
ncbi:hypothetical protein N9Y08_05500 [Paracoccaceae bacterium]|nr:hypothetical protein [Paracoccaceae bacterium]